MIDRDASNVSISPLWQQAFEHPDHLCHGKCPDEGYMDSRDPECFYCSVMTLCEAVQEKSLREPIAAYVRRLEPLASTDGLARYLAHWLLFPTTGRTHHDPQASLSALNSEAESRGVHRAPAEPGSPLSADEREKVADWLFGPKDAGV